MRQCPDCEEKDRVIIAGKVFCANCGTPWAPANKEEEQPYLKKMGVMTDAQPAPQVAAAPSATNAVPAPIPAPSNPITPAPTSQNVTPAAPVAPAAPSAMPDVTMAQSSVPAPVQPVVASTDTAPATPSVSQSAPVQGGAVPVMLPVGSQAPAPLPSAPIIAPASMTTPSSPVPAQPIAPIGIAPAVAQAVAPKPLQEQIGSEIPNLDVKDEAVLSDSQLKELSSVGAMPTMVRPADMTAPAPQAQPTVMNDVIMPSAAPSVNLPTAIPQVVPTAASSQPISASLTGGATLTREDALKLALGSDAENVTTASPAPASPARPAAVVMSVIALVLLGAYLFQVNYSTLALKLAGVRTGMDAVVPSYVPTGWTLSRDIKAGNGTIAYALTKADQKLTITQKQSDWDSQAVLEQYVLPKTNDYLALQAQGLTIYVYNSGQAAWVNHGNLFTLEGNHGLDQEQLIKVATSL